MDGTSPANGKKMKVTAIIGRKMKFFCCAIFNRMHIFGVGSKVRSGVAGTPFAQEGVSIGPRAFGELYYYRMGFKPLSFYQSKLPNPHVHAQRGKRMQYMLHNACWIKVLLRYRLFFHSSLVKKESFAKYAD